MGKYIKAFDTHTEYEEYYYDLETAFTNVCHCIQENDVHYNPTKHFAKLYNGTELISKNEIVYDNYGNTSNPNFYHSPMIRNIQLGGENYTAIELDLFNGVSNVQITTRDESSVSSSTSGFTYSLNGNILRIESTEGAWNKTNHEFYITFTNSEGQESACTVLINKQEHWA